MDTLGLAALGVPDLQCHFKNLDVAEVARVLYNSAYYLLDNGDVIGNQQTIQGIKPEDHWRCQHEDALVGPPRVVLDIDPGNPMRQVTDTNFSPFIYAPSTETEKPS